ncbi:Cobalamin biosynthesis protein CobD [Bombilactobacillus mellifer]|uniref:Cobalamin biosynthesis protein CobD n=1 Tax=Bombilactobacillus mellifer TaxID=1218492 RepID=A0A0F4LXI3_9LACO|nr:adenosylcobinamide-phosphate synthase CbiB [Bombilactobacillus mellifer]KJY62281.1 Cobalamin biosynthesis protein CobD [Bombilactobacillus mellifer]
MTVIWVTCVGFILDLLLGDPPNWPHPVKMLGNLISYLTRHLNRPTATSQQKRLGGIITVFVTIGLASGLVALLLKLVQPVPVLAYLIGIYFSYTCISTKQLAIEARKVIKYVNQGDLSHARQQLGTIVGRDTSQLNSNEIIKAAIETVAENTSDGVIAPLCYLLLAGPVGGIAYKAVNTLDSMIGYQNQQYQDFGKFAAKLDDWVNYLPARLTWCLLLVASWGLRLDYRKAFQIGKSDRKKHLSPNSAFAEAVVAGALHLQLGGPHTYFGQRVDKPYIGDDAQQIAGAQDLSQTIKMLYVTACLGLAFLVLIRFIVILSWK